MSEYGDTDYFHTRCEFCDDDGDCYYQEVGRVNTCPEIEDDEDN